MAQAKGLADTVSRNIPVGLTGPVYIKFADSAADINSGESAVDGSEVTWKTIPFDTQTFDTGFRFRLELFGPRGANIDFIQNQTGVQVNLDGDDDDGYMDCAGWP